MCDKRKGLIRLNQNGKEPGCIGLTYDITNELSVPGLKIAPKATILSGCDKKRNSGLLNAILFVQDISTAACVSGNGFV